MNKLQITAVTLALSSYPAYQMYLKLKAKSHVSISIDFIRHGQTDMNKNHIYHGWSEAQLTDLGIS